MRVLALTTYLLSMVIKAPLLKVNSVLMANIMQQLELVVRGKFGT